jgi:TRAP-type uncharacterized transport system substrate-binding protein
MYRSVAVSLIACLFGQFSTFAAAQEDTSPAASSGVVISSGISGGGYWSAASRLQSVAKEVGLEVAVLASSGSLENLEKLTDADSPVSLALAQADALQYYLGNNPGAAAQIQVLENIGQECVFFVTGLGSGIRSDADLQDERHRLGISTPTSGIAVTFNYMKSLVPEFRDLQVKYVDTRAVIDQLGDPGAEVDVVMMVQRPREHSVELETALHDPERYRLVAVEDDRLTEKLPNGQQVYRAMELAMPGDGGSSGLKTICVRGLLVANREKLSNQQSSQLSDVVNYHWMRVFATE